MAMAIPFVLGAYIAGLLRPLLLLLLLLLLPLRCRIRRMTH